jgi:DNA-binding SARP family transcriptional activator/predicted ATPase
MNLRNGYRINVCGHLKISGPAQADHTPKRRKEQALLAYLVLAGEAVARDTLLGLLWPELPDSEARNNLRVALSRLRRSLPETNPPLIRSNRSKIAFLPHATVQVDVHLLDALLAQSPTLVAVAAEQWRLLRELESCELLSGLYLDGCHAFDEWLFVRREQLRIDLLQRLDLLVDLLASDKRHDTALAVARRQTATDPLRESAHRNIMRLLAENGDSLAALSHYEVFAAYIEEELGVLPSAETRALAEQIRRAMQRCDAEPAHAESAAVRHNLHTALTTFFGRDAEVVALFELLVDPNIRLITLRGPGGIGKSRLATEFALQLINRPQPVDARIELVSFVPLVGLSEAADIPAAVAAAVGLALRGQSPIEAQLNAFLQATPTLLILDNFEQLLDGAHWLHRQLTTAPELRVIVTSREPLNILGEVSLELHGLDVPTQSTPAHEARAFDASSLFLDRCRLQDRAFRVSRTNWPSIVQICRLVEGMPLSLELASTWIRDLSAAEIAAEIASNIDFLESESIGFAVHQRSLRGVFEQSWQRLSPPEQQAFAALAVMHGPFSREAAQAISGASMTTLRQLRFKSLLRLEQSRHYTLHTLIRQFAAEKLNASGQHAVVEAAHAEWYLRLIAAYDDMLRTDQPAQMMQLLRDASDNIRAAWHHALAIRQTDLLCNAAKGLVSFHLSNGTPNFAYELLATTQAALDNPRDAANVAARQTVAHMLVYEGNIKADCGDDAEALQLLTRGREQASALGLRHLSAEAAYHLGRIALHRGDNVVAHRHFSEVLPVARETDDAHLTASALRDLGNIQRQRGDYQAFLDYLHQARAIYQRIGDQTHEHALLVWLGTYSSDLGRYWQGRQLLLEAQALQPQVGTAYTGANIIGGLGRNSELLGDYAGAVKLISLALNKLRQIGDSWRLISGLVHLGSALAANGSPADADTALAEALSLAVKGGYIELTGLVYLTRGILRLDTDQLTAAQADFEASVAIWEPIGRAVSLAECRLFLARIAQAGNRPADAAALSESALAFWQHRPIHGAWHRERLYANLYLLADRLGHADANRILSELRAEIRRSADAIEDPTYRACYDQRMESLGLGAAVRTRSDGIRDPGVWR